jgi:hypothetical protein
MLKGSPLRPCPHKTQHWRPDSHSLIVRPVARDQGRTVAVIHFLPGWGIGQEAWLQREQHGPGQRSVSGPHSRGDDR